MIDVGAFVVRTAGAASKRRNWLGVEIRPGSESRAKAAKGFPGNLRDPSDFFPSKRAGAGAKPAYQRPGATGEKLRVPEASEMRRRKGSKRDSKEYEEPRNEQRKS